MDILVVDDDADNAASMGELFELEGHKVKVVHSGESAIAAYVGGSFDLAFMDVMMPGMNGVDSFMAIRRMRPSARVYMMTGYSVEELLQQAITEGALGVLEKPFDAREVLYLSRSVGSGMVVSTNTGVGQSGVAIQTALSANGIRSKLVTSLLAMQEPISSDEVLVVDAELPLLDCVTGYKAAQERGHKAPTFVVPSQGQNAPDHSDFLRNISVTGILNKPFDPLDLLTRLPALAA